MRELHHPGAAGIASIAVSTRRSMALEVVNLDCCTGRSKTADDGELGEAAQGVTAHSAV